MKKRKLIFLLPIAAMALGACGNKEEPKDEPGQQEEGGGGGGEQEETVSLAIKDKTNFELEVGSSKKLEAELKGTTGTLVWASSAEGVARVDQAGNVTAVAVGTATISVTFGDYIDSVVVTVTQGEVPPQPATFQEAYEEAAKLSNDGKEETAEAYTLIGVVVARQGNSFFMQNGDYTIEIYNKLIDETPAVIGKEVKAVTTLKNYRGCIESATVTSLEYTGNDGTVSPVAIANKAALDGALINTAITPAQLTVVTNDGTYSSTKSDGKLTVKIGEDTETVTLIMSKYCVNNDAAGVLANAQPGDLLTVSKAIVAAYNGKMQISLSDDSVVTKEANPDKEVLSITIEGALVNTEFEVGDAYSAAGLSVLAHCKDESTFTANVTITLDKEVAALGDTKLTASAEFEGKQASKDFDISVIPKAPDPVKDVTFNKIGEQADLVDGKYLIATTYEDTTSKEDVTYVYHGKDTTKETVKVTTADSIVGTDGMAGVQIEAVPDGYTLKILNGANKGKYMGGKSDGNGLVFSDTPVLNTITFNNGVPTIMSEGKTLTFNSNADQLRFRYMANVNKPVSLYWAGTLTPVLTSLELTNGPTKTEYVAGEIFEPAGMVITAKYNHGGQDKIIEATDYTIDKTTLAVGDEFVTVSYEENGVTKTVQVPVTVTKAPVPVTGVTLNKTELSMKVNEADFTLEATVAPADADDPTVTWSLSKEGVVTVNNGVLHAVAEGEVIVTATAGDYHADCVVTVAPADKVLSGIEVTTQPAKTQYVAGESFDPTDMVVTASYSSGHDSEPVTGYTFSTAALTEADTTVEIDYNGQKAYVTITVSPAPVLESISVANASGKTNEYVEGDVISKDDLVVTAHYTESKPDAVVKDYTISLTEGLTLSDTSATITYVEGGVEKTATYTFTVAEKEVEVSNLITADLLSLGTSYGNFSKVLPDTGIVLEGNAMQKSENEKTIQFRAASNNSGIYTRTSNRAIQSIEIEFTSDNSDTRKLSVYGQDDGYKAPGQTGTKITDVDASGTKTIEVNGAYRNVCFEPDGACYVSSIKIVWSSKAEASSATAVTLNKATDELAKDATTQLSAFVEGLVPSQEVTWSSNDNDVATVDENGLVTAKAGGTAEITAASVQNPDAKAICTITVSSESKVYTKVESDLADWSGTYILVYENGNCAWTGVDASGCSKEVSISNSSIENPASDIVTLNITKSGTGYAIQIVGGTNNGKYLDGKLSSGKEANGTAFSATAAECQISIDSDGSTKIVSSKGTIMRYNNAESNGNWFRFYKSTSYTAQQAVSLYKLA